MAAIDGQVLVLNRLWQPVHICCVHRAFTLLFLDHAQVVSTDDEPNYSTHDFESWLVESEKYNGDHIVRTVSHKIRVPAIIVLNQYDRLPKQDIKFTRRNVFERDRFTCQYCGKRFEPKELNIDHVIPRDKGGPTNWENVVCSCINCNSRKANHLPAQVNMFPLRKPQPPKWRPLFGGSRSANHSRIMDESWRHFLEPCSSKVSVSR